MRGKVIVENEENYNKWLAKRETFESFLAKKNVNTRKLVKINNLSSDENSLLRKK